MQLLQGLEVFQQTMNDIETAYEEIIKRIGVLKEKQVEKLREIAAFYADSVDTALQEVYSNLGKGDNYIPSNALSQAIWTQPASQWADFNVTSQVLPAESLIDQLVQVRWVLPLPGFSNCPEDAFTMKIVLDPGEIVSLAAHPHDSLSDLKSMLIRKGKIIQSDMQFYINSQRLDDHLTIADCGLSPSSVLHLTSLVTIHVTTSDWNSVEMTGSFRATVGGFLACLPAHVNSEYYLLYDHQILQNHASLRQCGLFNGAQVRIVLRVMEPFDVIVMEPDARRLVLHMENADVTIEQVKDMIKRAEMLSPDLYSLIFQNMELSDAQPLAYYSIGNGSELALMPKEQVKRQLFVVISPNQILDIWVDLWTTLQTVKQKIQEKAEIDLRTVQIAYEGKILQESHFLISYNLPLNPKFYLHFGIIQIFIRTLNGKTISLDVKITDTVLATKDKIQAKEGVPVEQQRLLFAGKQLRDDSKLEDCKVEQGVTLQLMLRAGIDPTGIFIVLAGKRIAAKAQPNDSIAVIKSKVGLSFGDYLLEERLLYQENILEDDKTLQDYSIPLGSTLHFLIKNITIRVETPRHGTISLEIFLWNTVLTVKEAICTKTAILASEQILIFSEKELENEQSLAICGIPNNAVLTVLLKNLFILVITMQNTDKTLTLKVNSRDTVKNIKKKIKENAKIPLRSQRLIYEERELENEKPLYSYFIVKDTTVQLSVIEKNCLLS